MTAQQAWDAWDDPSIPDEDRLLRKIHRRPDFAVRDLVTGRLLVQTAALRLDPDGMSTQREGLLPLIEATREDLYEWDRFYGIEFPVSVARSTGQAGVVDEVDPEDERLGAAHSLVRTKDPHPARASWKEVRAVIAYHCEWMREDPSRLDGETENEASAPD